MSLSKSTNAKSMSDSRRKVRYAVVGLGYISQIAVLPAFGHASENSELRALVSSDETKLKSSPRSTRSRIPSAMSSTRSV